jgi:hypothetical protein
MPKWDMSEIFSDKLNNMYFDLLPIDTIFFPDAKDTKFLGIGNLNEKPDKLIPLMVLFTKISSKPFFTVSTSGNSGISILTPKW